MSDGGSPTPCRRHDYPHHLGLAQLGYERYFEHRQRTDDCANCMVGDRAQGLAKNLANELDNFVVECRQDVEQWADLPLTVEGVNEYRREREK